MIRRAGLKQGKVLPAAGAQERRRDAKADEKRERREKKLNEILIENEKKIAGKTNCLQAQGKSFWSILHVAYQLTGNQAKAKEM